MGNMVYTVRTAELVCCLAVLIIAVVLLLATYQGAKFEIVRFNR